MPGMKVKAGIAGMVMITGSMIITTQPSNEAHAAACPALPEVAWWKTNHDKIVKYVDQRYNGIWEPYIDKWRNYRKKMQAIHDKDGTAIVKSRGIRLKGASLEKHIDDVERRILVTQCLQQKHSGQLALAGPSQTRSVAGAGSSLAGVFQAAKQQALQLASLPGSQLARSSNVSFRQEERSSEVTNDKLDLEISAKCDGRTPVFQVTNLGDRWSRLAAISIYRTDGKAMVTKRRMKLESSQQATFKVRKRGKALAGEVGMFIQPSWANRPFQYDSKITCSS